MDTEVRVLVVKSSWELDSEAEVPVRVPVVKSSWELERKVVRPGHSSSTSTRRIYAHDKASRVKLKKPLSKIIPSPEAQKPYLLQDFW